MTTIDRIKEICSAKGISIARLERDLKFSNGVISKSDTIKDTRLIEVAEYLGVSAAYLLGESESEPYYIDPETLVYVEELKTNTELKALFDVTRDMPKEKLEAIYNLLKNM